MKFRPRPLTNAWLVANARADLKTKLLIHKFTEDIAEGKYNGVYVSFGAGDVIQTWSRFYQGPSGGWGCC